jgi:aspartyl-tRNA(Asn)/glutamyl-tRNA(Gln) amidotransferase subunit A
MTATRIGTDTVENNGETHAAPPEMTRFTYPFNVSGFPALSVPCGFDYQGLPIGLQLASGPWREALLLQVGHAFQRATEWHTRRPDHLTPVNAM